MAYFYSSVSYSSLSSVLYMTGSEKRSFMERKKDHEDKDIEIIKEAETLSPFLEKGNKFAISTSRIENSLATKISTSNLCK